METKEKVFEKGVIVWRRPNLAQLMNLAGRIGFSTQPDRARKMVEESELVWFSRVIEHIGPLVVSIQFDGKPVEYDTALEMPEMYEPIKEVASDVFMMLSNFVSSGSKKKTTETKPTKSVTAPKAKKQKTAQPRTSPA